MKHLERKQRKTQNTQANFYSMNFSNTHLFTNSQDEKLLKNIQPPTMMLLIGIQINFTKKANESHYSTSYCCCHGSLLKFFYIRFSTSANQLNSVLHNLPPWLNELNYLILDSCPPTPQTPGTGSTAPPFFVDSNYISIDFLVFL